MAKREVTARIVDIHDTKTDKHYTLEEAIECGKLQEFSDRICKKVSPLLSQIYSRQAEEEAQRLLSATHG